MRRQVKAFARRAFPSLWRRWRLRHQPALDVHELALLDRLVRRDRVSLDVGANIGLYTVELARRSRQVHAFEPLPDMAALLRRTVPRNVVVHDIALSDRSGEAELVIPSAGGELVHGLASLEPGVGSAAGQFAVQKVPMRPLDAVIRDEVAFVKIDVEGHELHVLDGARELIDRSRPVFLVEAEERHRPGATQALFRFFGDRGYATYFILDGDAVGAERFDPSMMQDPDALLSDGGHQQDRHYVNNFYCLPGGLDARILTT
jgi:FkbM family methyltransferase